MSPEAEYILDMSDPSASLALVGGKGLSLFQLAASGLPVPPFFCVTTAAYQKFVEINDLQPQIAQLMAGLTGLDTDRLLAVSDSISELFASGELPVEISEEVLAACIRLNSSSVAVRSSATAEDLPDASFAGQQETFLNVRSGQAVLQALRKCWASLWTARAMAYRARQGIDPGSVALAVVVQEMVPAEAAGVMFTADPVLGNRDEMVINAAWGLGEAVVSGAVSPDTIRVSRSDGTILAHTTERKLVMTVQTASGTADEPVVPALQNKAVLTDGQVADLARMGVQIEDLFGVPMDIEWALSGGQFAILQARPITTLPEPGAQTALEWRLANPHAIGMRVSFSEFVPDAVPPLFATLALPIANFYSDQLIAAMAGAKSNGGYYFDSVHGYVFSCMDMRFVGRYLGFTLVGASRITRYGRERRAEVQSRSREGVEKWRLVDLKSEPAVNLLAGVRELFGLTADYYTVAQSGPIPMATSSEALFSLFYKLLVKRKTDPAAGDFLVGLDSLPLQAEKALYDLAKWAAGQVELSAFLCQTPAPELVRSLRLSPPPAPLDGEFAQRFDAYLSQYGHFVYDLDFCKPVPASDPMPVLKTLQAYISGSAADPYQRIEAQTKRRLEFEEVILGRLDPVRRWIFKRLLQWAQRCAPERENAIADLGLPYPQIQRLLRELGGRLQSQGTIDRPEDVDWLESDEVDRLAVLLDRNEPLEKHQSMIAVRKKQAQRFAQVIPPQGFPENHWIIRLFAHKKPAAGSLSGVGVSAGQVTAPACVLRGVEDFSHMQPGAVIVAVTTTPAWTPLFAMASAVVTDIGGPLSHSSIVAREYGIPAVMAAGSATRSIHNGQIITVDGNNGIVTLHNNQ